MVQNDVLPDEGALIKESIKGKGGVELFRELLRHLPTIVVEDYYKNGVWQNELMRLDIEIVACHRIGAGASDPKPLEEVPMPKVPNPPKALLSGLVRPLGMLNAMRPLGLFSTSVAPGLTPGLLRPTAPNGLPPLQIPGLRPVAMQNSLTAAAAAAINAAAAAKTNAMGTVPGQALGVKRPSALALSGAVADLRQIALFVSKWRLEPTRTKELLQKLPPERRRWVMNNFAYVPVNGTPSTVKLEEYITQCQRTDAWGATSVAVGPVVSPGASCSSSLLPAAGGTAAAVGSSVALGVKRPLEQPGTDDQNLAKRAAVGPQAAATATVG